MKRTIVLLLGSLCAISAAFATTYVRVEKDGSKTYSDRPLPGGHPVEVQPAQSYSAAPSTPSSGNLPREQRLLQEMSNFRYGSCAISPANDTTFTNPDSVAVGVQLQPPLRAGDVVQMIVDGRAAGGSEGMAFTMAPVERGTHSVSVVIRDAYGNTLCSAQASFHVHRPSLNTPGRH